MDRTTQFAEYLPNLITPRITQDCDKAAITRKPMRPAHATWRAFQAGMEVLHTHARRSAANPRTIAKANLQLLHRALLRDPAYILSLKNASNSAGGHRVPASYCIFEHKNLRAELLALQSGTTLQLKSQPGSYAMYLSIRGNPSLHCPDSTTTARKHWWVRYRQTPQEEFLKDEAAVFISPPQTSTLSLTATTKECILLRILVSGASLN